MTPWKVPDWMRPYIHVLVGVGDDIEWTEELMNDHKTTVFVNAPRALQCVSIKAQIGMLTRLYQLGCLHIAKAANTATKDGK